MSRCNWLDRLDGARCIAATPCPIHNPEGFRREFGNAHELHAIGGTDGENDTYEIFVGPIAFDVMRLRKEGVSPELIAKLYTDLSAVYRRWEMRDLAPPQWGVYHHVDHWLIHGADRSKGRGGFFTDDVRLAQPFEHLGEIASYLDALGLMHPEAPGNHERAGFTILRIR